MEIVSFGYKEEGEEEDCECRPIINGEMNDTEIDNIIKKCGGLIDNEMDLYGALTTNKCFPIVSPDGVYRFFEYLINQREYDRLDSTAISILLNLELIILLDEDEIPTGEDNSPAFVRTEPDYKYYGKSVFDRDNKISLGMGYGKIILPL